QIELIGMARRIATELAPAIGEHAEEPHAVGLEERQHAIIEQVGRGEGRLLLIELGEGDLAVSVDEGLLIHLVDAPHAFERADEERVLRTAVAGALALELAVGLVARAPPLKRGELRLGVDEPSWALCASSAFKRFLNVSRSWRCHTQRTPPCETTIACFASSFATRSWPHAGCARAYATIVASTSGGMRFFSNGFLREISSSAASPPCEYSCWKR